MNTAIIFDHRWRSNDEGPIEIRITINRKAYYINTGIKVLRRQLIGGTIVDRMDCVELNERLSIIYNKVQEELNYYIRENLMPDVSKIKKNVLSLNVASGKEDRSLIDFIDGMMSVMNLSEGTLKHYSTLKTRLVEFGEMLSFRDVTSENIYKWDAWLHQLNKFQSNALNLSSIPSKKISDAAVYNYHKNLKAILNRAIRLEKIDFNPYDRLRGEFRRGDVERLEYLTDEEMQAIESLHPVHGTQMAVTRDLFVFQMHTGLSYADTQAFDFSKYSKINGKWCTINERVKTGVQYVIQLSDECVRILKSYNWQLPTIGNAKYNKCLKTLAIAAGIDKNLHSHLARHSFATMMTASGAPIQNVSRMLGHANITQTMRYAKVKPESIFDDFNKIRKKKKQ